MTSNTKYKNTFLLYVKYIAYTTGLLPSSHNSQNRRKLSKIKRALHHDGKENFTLSHIWQYMQCILKYGKQMSHI